MTPLGMPKGSVRAIIALLVVLAVIVLAAAAVVRGYPEESLAAGALLTAFGTVVEKYFAARKSDEAPDETRCNQGSDTTMSERRTGPGTGLMAVLLAAGMAAASGCASTANGWYHTQRDMATDAQARDAGFRVMAFDPEVGGPSIAADFSEIVANLWNNHLPSTLVCAGIDAAVIYYAGDRFGWWGGGSDGESGSGSDAAPLAQTPTSTGRDTIIVQGDGNTVDASSGHNTDDHSNPATAPVEAGF